VLLLSLLATGVAFSHYRVTVMAASGAAVWVLLRSLNQKSKWVEGRTVILGLTLTAVVAGILVAPWLWNLVRAGQQGFAAGLSKPTLAAFSLSRIGTVATYPTNYLLLGLTVLAVGWGFWRREPLVIGLAVWAAGMMIASGPHLAGILMDSVSVFIALYFPMSVVIGWFTWQLLETFGARRSIRWGMGVSLLGLALWGAIALSSIVEPGSAYVTSEDLPAMEWIQANTPPTARFMVNTFNWDFLPELIIGSDAGYWLPLVAQRQTVTMPLASLSERMQTDGFIKPLVALHHLGGDLTSPEAQTLLTQAGITYIYLGQRGGLIQPAKLLASKNFRLEYQAHSTYVFKFLPSQ
jgi:hypothetical protein